MMAEHHYLGAKPRPDILEGLHSEPNLAGG